MPRSWALLAVLLLGAPLAAADLTLLANPANRVLTGDLVSLSVKECLFKDGTEARPHPLAEVVSIKLADESAVVPQPYTQVVLTDGSVLLCKPDGVVFDKKALQLTLLTGTEVRVPLTALSHLLKNADSAKVRDHEDWKALLKRRRGSDSLVLVSGDRLNDLEGTAIEGNGAVIDFKPTDPKYPMMRPDLKLPKLQGILFANPGIVNPPPSTCRVVDQGRNAFLASAVETTETGDLQLTLLSADSDAPKLLLQRAQVALIDYSKGRFDYLSDLKPDIEEEPSDDVLLRYRFHADDEKDKRNRTLAGGRLRLDNREYERGLCLPAPTVLAYALKGEYKELSATVGIDDVLAGDSHVRLVIDGDGTKLFDEEIDRSRKAVAVRLDVKGIQKLRVSVKSAGVLDLWNHLDIVDAKVAR